MCLFHEVSWASAAQTLGHLDLGAVWSILMYENVEDLRTDTVLF